MRRIYGLLLCAAMLLLGAAKASETPEGNGSIRGKITTTEGAAAADVTIQVKNSPKGAISDADGNFQIKGLAAGSYELHISLMGYQDLTEKVTLAANEAAVISIRLQLTQKELEEVIIKTGVRSYKASAVSSSLRLQTPLLQVPQNIQVVTGKALADQQVISMSDGAIRNVSGAIRMEHWGDMYTNITARGSQIQAFRNGFNMVNSFWGPLTEDMSFVDHIEFVKGPAGFMLGNGDPSGLYNVVTKKPTGQTKGEAGLTIGSFDLYRATLDLDGKLSKDGKLLYRLNLAGQQKKSHRANEYNNRYSIAPVISYQIDNKTKLTAEYTWQKASMSDLGSYYVFSSAGFATLPVGFTSLPAGLPGTNINDHTVLLNLQHQFNSHWKVTAQAGYSNYRQVGSSMWPNAVNPNGTMIRSVGSWDAKSAMTMAQAYLNGDIATGKVRHRILGGIDVATKEYFADWGQSHALDTVGAEFNTRNPNLGAPVNGYPSFNFRTPLEQRAAAIGGTMSMRNTGVYFQDELGFFDNLLRVTLAGRYTTVTQAQWGGAAITASRFTPRIGISVSLDKQTSVYGLYDQAFVPQGGRLANGGKVKPITGNNLEFGIKRDWAGGRWNTGLTVYRILKENELTADPFSPPASGLSIVMGQKRAQGIEFDLKGRLAKGLDLVANYALTDSKITRVANGVTSMKVGDVVPGYARHTANVWLTYRLQEGVLKGLGFSSGLMFLDGRKTYWDISPDPNQVLPAYTKLDAGISYEKDNLVFNFNVFNVLNKYLYNGSYYSWLKAYNWQTDPPRNLRFSVNYRF
ncbi:TonB-dependent receptor [Sediminibacterium soli]|uniref:TonB-dependent receptor n=1 Tax=Sediminibacterium soli TaxID=2698829 RepID=UPI00137B0B6D|nr:TonB-dependent receptor [Sediminibacterium soli]NCI46533.1 TonB-dependent receptor [Sediminibacterium soli]